MHSVCWHNCVISDEITSSDYEALLLYEQPDEESSSEDYAPKDPKQEKFNDAT